MLSSVVASLSSFVNEMAFFGVSLISIRWEIQRCEAEAARLESTDSKGAAKAREQATHLRVMYSRMPSVADHAWVNLSRTVASWLAEGLGAFLGTFLLPGTGTAIGQIVLSTLVWLV